jgi:arylsulfatase A
MWIRFLLLLPLTLTLSVSAVQAKKKNNDGDGKKPNFIVLFMDDLGYGDVGFNGHPTTKTPNLDHLAWNGKILTTWYSGCHVCTGSRSALMTGRQFPRTGLPGVLNPVEAIGLPLNETTLAEQLRKQNYTTAIVGKWHLGQRPIYLPGNRGFDYYLGIPYSDDMGDGVASECPAGAMEDEGQEELQGNERETKAARTLKDETPDSHSSSWSEHWYDAKGFLNANAHKNYPNNNEKKDPAANYLPLVYQEWNQTSILEQPLDFTTLAQKYNDFILEYLENQKDDPFFLYLPFSHVHCTSETQPEMQYAGCGFQDSTLRGGFGDALAEVDWIVGNIMDKLRALDLEEDTLILFTSDNGPWMTRGLSAGTAGLFTGRYAGYWNTGKGSTWEGGIRMPAFAYWKGKIKSHSRSAEVVSSLDVFPTLSALAGVPLPANRTYDGRDMSEILLQDAGKSKHDFLFFYSTCSGDPYWSVSSVRHGKYKAHFCTAPGIGPPLPPDESMVKRYDPPLLFNVERDPSEAAPISANETPSDPNDRKAMERILKAYAMEKATFQFGDIVPYPDGPGEGPDRYGLCCDRSQDCYCVGKDENVGIFNLGTKTHHDKYHEVLGEEEPSPPRTRAQAILQGM